MNQDKMSFFTEAEGVSREKIVYLLSSATVTTYSMKVNEHVVVVETDAANAITVTLPSVAEARGMMYTIRLETDGGVDLTLQDHYDDAGLTDLTFNDAAEVVTLYSDGLKWHELENTIT